MGVFLHQAQRIGIDQMMRLRATGHRNHHNIGVAHHRIQCCQLTGRHAKIRHFRTIMKHHIHTKPVMAAPRNRLADAAHADDPHSLAANMHPQHLHRMPTLPLTAAHQPLAFARAPCRHQNQRHGNIGCGISDSTRRVGHDNGLGLCARNINVIIANPEIGQYFAAGRCGLANRLARKIIAQRGQHRIIGQQRICGFALTHRPVLRAQMQVIFLRQNGHHIIG